MKCGSVMGISRLWEIFASKLSRISRIFPDADLIKIMSAGHTIIWGGHLEWHSWCATHLSDSTP